MYRGWFETGINRNYCTLRKKRGSLKKVTERGLKNLSASLRTSKEFVFRRYCSDLPCGQVGHSTNSLCKVEFHAVICHWRHTGEMEVEFLPIFDLSARWGWVVKATPPPLCPREQTRYPWYRQRRRTGIHSAETPSFIMRQCIKNGDSVSEKYNSLIFRIQPPHNSEDHNLKQTKKFKCHAFSLRHL